MAIFEVEINDYDIKSEGWIKKAELTEKINDIDHYYFRNNLQRDQVYNDIMDILTK